VTLRARWVTLRALWVTLRARWVTLRARWSMLIALWVTAAQVIKTLSSGITINLVGLAATLVGLEATCGMLFAKELSFAATSPFSATQVLSQARPVQALDIFVVQVPAPPAPVLAPLSPLQCSKRRVFPRLPQASANTLLSHFIAVCFSLWLLRMMTTGDSTPAAEPPAATA
jgi:hypothetical protein